MTARGPSTQSCAGGEFVSLGAPEAAVPGMTECVEKAVRFVGLDHIMGLSFSFGVLPPTEEFPHEVITAAWVYRPNYDTWVKGQEES